MLLYGANKEVREWVSQELFGNSNSYNDGDKAIGVVHDNKLIAGVVYNNYIPEISIEMSIASVDKRWGKRYNIKAFFKYPFIDLRVKRVTTLCSATEGVTMNFNKRLGFVQEGLHRQACYDGSDAVSFGMLKDECRWL